MECLKLRIKDGDFAHSQLIVRDGKSQKDRATLLPPPLKDTKACSSPLTPLG